MAQDDLQDRKDEVRRWLSEISTAKKREQDYRKEGRRILMLYGGSPASDEGRSDFPETTKSPFNILFSNTETMMPALYSQVPRPIVQRRFKDADPIGKLAAVAGQRMLEFLLDTNVDGYETFDEGLQNATLDALLPGRAVTSIKYDADMGTMAKPNDADQYDDQNVKGNDQEIKEEPVEYAKSELVCVNSRSWNKVYFGYATKWSKVPWIAYEEQIDRSEATRLFGQSMADKLNYIEHAIDEKNEDRDHYDYGAKGERKTTTILQIWDRAGGRKIRYISEQYGDDYLKLEDDPLGLTGFYNCPKPLQFIIAPNSLHPIPPYSIYENQAKELNRIQQRINRIIEAMKARGLYDGNLGSDVEKVFSIDENGLAPAEQGSTLAAQGGLEKSIWFMPLDVLQKVLNQLYIAREQCKQVIYEITGISDIIRGTTKASETLGAQQIKNQWGTLRLKRHQKEIQRYSRDLLRMMLEVSATKFSEDTWAKMTGLPFVTTMQRQQLESIFQAAQMTGQPIDPQTQQQLQAPVWGQILQVLRDDIQRAYRIDIETNSTVEPEAAEDQQKLTELMTALGQAMNSLAPLIAKGVMPFEMAKSVLLIIAKRHRFGVEVEDIINAMQPPPPPDDGNNAEASKLQAQQQMEQAKLQTQQQMEQAKLQIEQAKLQMEQAESAAKLQHEQAVMQAKLQQDLQIETMKLEAERIREEMKLSMQLRIEQMKAKLHQQTELQKANLVATAKLNSTRGNLSEKVVA